MTPEEVRKRFLDDPKFREETRQALRDLDEGRGVPLDQSIAEARDFSEAADRLAEAARALLEDRFHLRSTNDEVVATDLMVALERAVQDFERVATTPSEPAGGASPPTRRTGIPRPAGSQVAAAPRTADGRGARPSDRVDRG